MTAQNLVPKIRSKISFASIRLETCFNKNLISTGTGFFYKANNCSYLVTNWHIVSGRHLDTKELLSSKAAIPNKLIMHLPYRKPCVNDILDTVIFELSWKEETINLSLDGKNVWLEHPVYKDKVDVVVIPISNIENADIYHVNDEIMGFDDFDLYAGQDVFIAGFPIGISSGGKIPIWKRGSIATEPEINIDGVPKFLIDSATRQGMSGSPVYAQHIGFIHPKKTASSSNPLGEFSLESQIGSFQKFAGVYSGRVDNDTFQAQLGTVWKSHLIDEIIRQLKNNN